MKPSDNVTLGSKFDVVKYQQMAIPVGTQIRSPLPNPKNNLTSPSADRVRLYVNVQFKVKSLSTSTSSSQTKKTKNTEFDPPNVCAMFQDSSTSIS